MNSKTQRQRAIIFVALVQVLLSILILRVFHIEKNAERLREQSQKLINSEIKLRIRRGKICDTNGKELAVNINTLSVIADPKGVKDPAKAAKKLAPVLEISAESLQRKLESDRRYVRLARDIIDLNLINRIEEIRQQEKFNWIGYEIGERRVYPQKDFLSHVLGYVNYEGFGREGVEAYYDEEIRYYVKPYPIRRSIRNDIFEYPVGEPNPPKYNSELILTIDEMIQHFAESELEKACKQWEARAGVVIIMQPKTGAVLALANYPSYDANKLEDLNEENALNRAIRYAFEPGSIFKIVPAAAAIEVAQMSPGSKVFCENGGLPFGGHLIEDIVPYGWLTFEEVIAKSSNIGTIKIAHKVGRKNFERYIRAFGFGRKTGIDLPAERTGGLKALSEWSDESILTYLPFGHGLSVTPIQILCAYNAIANGGVMMRPRLAKEIRDCEGNVIKKFPPEVVSRVVSARTAKTLVDILTAVVEYGTGTKAAVDGIETAGKTGTAQKPDKNGGYSEVRSVSSFVGFFPAHDPEYSMLVIIDEPKGEDHGGEVAAPVFSAIGNEIIRYKKVSRIQSRARGKQTDEIRSIVSRN